VKALCNLPPCTRSLFPAVPATVSSPSAASLELQVCPYPRLPIIVKFQRFSNGRLTLPARHVQHTARYR
jgi:hypothetical protein